MKQLETHMSILRKTSAIALMIAMGGATAHAETKQAVKDIVIVHGALVDAAGWRAVYDVLSKDGFHVTIVQEPLLRHQWHSRGLDLGDVADRLCRTWPSRISASAE